MTIPTGPNPYAPPQANLTPGLPGPLSIYAEGDQLVVENGSSLPSVCLKCGAVQGLEWRDQKFMYVPPWARLFGVLIQAVVAKRSRFNLPLCSACHQVWKKWNLWAALSWIPGTVLSIVGGGVIAAGFEDVGVVFFLIGFVALFAGLIVALVKRNKLVIVASKIDKQRTWFRGVHALVFQAIRRT